MPITVFPDLILSNQVIEGGVKGRSVRKNQRVTAANGYESINISMDRSKREYDLGIGPLRRSAWQQIESIFEVTEGGAYGFLLLDPKDSTVALTEGLVAGPISGAPNTFQLFKRYTEPVSGRYKDRKITRPIATGLSVRVDGTPATFSVDAETGRIEITGQTTSAGVTWSGRFYVPVHFLNDQIDWEMVVWGPDPDGRFASGPQVTVQEILEGLPVS
jgi:uncharacterized protein (TIGR02217 family)